MPRTREAREPPLNGPRAPGPAALSTFPKPARRRSAEGLQSGGRARLTRGGTRGGGESPAPLRKCPLGGGLGGPHLLTEAKVSGGEEGASPSAPAGTLAMTGKSVKDVDRYQAVLANLLLEEDNKFCADCQSKGSVTPTPGGREVLRLTRRAWEMAVWGGGFWSVSRPSHPER